MPKTGPILPEGALTFQTFAPKVRAMPPARSLDRVLLARAAAAAPAGRAQSLQQEDPR